MLKKNSLTNFRLFHRSAENRPEFATLKGSKKTKVVFFPRPSPEWMIRICVHVYIFFATVGVVYSGGGQSGRGRRSGDLCSRYSGTFRRRVVWPGWEENLPHRATPHRTGGGSVAYVRQPKRAHTCAHLRHILNYTVLFVVLENNFKWH